ncbi:hypothetical protein DK880_00785 [Candidatus Cardinium hertigii]|uniref:Uncharacterized protein n=1 Tax=Candidatus Cardinium hertigii TaxID=247481 RepID=A0A2Z3LI18_9BACT|nr:hypothetical protein DK880_00785 [Candidatus Cardinium hertigii]
MCITAIVDNVASATLLLYLKVFVTSDTFDPKVKPVIEALIGFYTDLAYSQNTKQPTKL